MVNFMRFQNQSRVFTDGFPAEPRLYSCSFCQRAVDSAWALVQHVQTSHGIQIYSEESKPGRVGESAQALQPDTPAPGLSQVQETLVRRFCNAIQAKYNIKLIDWAVCSWVRRLECSLSNWRG